jgi:hypothetical protein
VGKLLRRREAGCADLMKARRDWGHSRARRGDKRIKHRPTQAARSKPQRDREAALAKNKLDGGGGGGLG